MRKSTNFENHFLLLLFFLVSYAVSYTIVSLLSVSTNFLYPVAFGDFNLVMFPIYTMILMLILALLARVFIPSLRVDKYPNLIIQLGYAFIFAINYLFAINNWSLEFSMNYGSFIQLKLTHLLIYSLLFQIIGIFLICRILYTPIMTEISKLSTILENAMNELYVVVIMGLSSVVLSISAIYSNFDFIDLTAVTKVVILILFAFASQPSKN